MDTQIVIEHIVEWINEKVIDAGCDGVVFGLSGGIDSAVVAAIAKQAFPENSLGLIMPCHSIEEDEKHARLVADKINLNIEKVDLTSTYDELVKNIKKKEHNQLALSNIKPRLRMTTLYYYAQINNYLVLGPTNKSEFVTGYFTKHGDSGVDLLPIADFVKGEIYKMARILDIPKEIINKPPSAGLVKNQTDEDEMGIKYKDLDNFILNNEADTNIIDKINIMYSKTKHKRDYPPIFKEI